MTLANLNTGLFIGFNPNTGKPLANGKLETREPGTTDLKAAFSDRDGTTHENPILLGPDGSARVFLDGATDLVLMDENDVVIWTLDRVYGALDEATVQDAINTAAAAVSLGFGTQTVNADQTLTTSVASKLVLVNAAAGDVTVSLPPAVGMATSAPFVIRRTDTTANVVTIDPDGAELIAGTATFAMDPGDYIELRTDGTQWFLTSDNLEPTSIENSLALVTSTGTGGAYAVTLPQTVLAPIANRLEFEFIANHRSVAPSTLNVNGTGALPFRKSKTGFGITELDGSDIATSDVVRVKYDGTQYIGVSLIDIANVDRLGRVLRASEAQLRSGADFRWPTASEIRTVYGNGWIETAEIDLTNGGSNNLTSVDFLSLPDDLSEIEVHIHNLSFNGANDLLVQAMVAGAAVSSGYDAVSRGGSSQLAASTAGMISFQNSDGGTRFGWFEFKRQPGSNRWVSMHQFAGFDGGGSVELAGVLDGIRILSSGSNEFDDGVASLRYR